LYKNHKPPNPLKLSSTQNNKYTVEENKYGKKKLKKKSIPLFLVPHYSCLGSICLRPRY